MPSLLDGLDDEPEAPQPARKVQPDPKPTADPDAPLKASPEVLARVAVMSEELSLGRLDEIDAGGLVVRFYSRILREWVVLAAESASLPDVEPLLIYRVSEARLLARNRPDARALRTLHETKRVFAGEVVDPKP